MTTSPHVSVRNLRKQYGDFAAVDGVSFDIQAGETFALLGPNGAGKSTTIEILEGYRDRTSGEASVLGVDPQRGGLAWKARLGIVLQSTGESGNVTVREQLAHFAGFYPNPRDVDEVIAAVGLTEKAKSRIKSLSGGQRRRVDVALGVVGRPELLFLDEPTTGFGTIDEIGGADARTPVVRWNDQDGPHEERTDEPAALIARLYATTGREPSGLEVRRPSLEDVYLNLVAAHTNQQQQNTDQLEPSL